MFLFFTSTQILGTVGKLSGRSPKDTGTGLCGNVPRPRHLWRNLNGSCSSRHGPGLDPEHVHFSQHLWGRGPRHRGALRSKKGRFSLTLPVLSAYRGTAISLESCTSACTMRREHDQGRIHSQTGRNGGNDQETRHIKGYSSRCSLFYIHYS